MKIIKKFQKCFLLIVIILILGPLCFVVFLEPTENLPLKAEAELRQRDVGRLVAMINYDSTLMEKVKVLCQSGNTLNEAITAVVIDTPLWRSPEGSNVPPFAHKNEAGNMVMLDLNDSPYNFACSHEGKIKLITEDVLKESPSGGEED